MKISVVPKPRVKVPTCGRCHTYSPTAKKVNRINTCPECAVQAFKKS